jgi:hypothetical protein
MDYEKFDRVEEKALNRLKEGETEEDALQPMNDDSASGLKRKQSKMSSMSGSGNNYYVEK